jgi:hypothetical protein
MILSVSRAVNKIEEERKAAEEAEAAAAATEGEEPGAAIELTEQSNPEKI